MCIQTLSAKTAIKTFNECIICRLTRSREVKNDVDSYASMTKRSRSFIVKEAIAAYMGERVAYLSELYEAVASIDTHPTYDFNKVTNWTKTWGTKDEKSLSKEDLTQ